MSDEVPTINLDQFLKLTGIVATGGEAKLLVRSGEVRVNDEPESRRGRKLVPGDTVTVGDDEFIVELEE